MTDITILDIFIRRMNKLNINLELVGNYPWVYINKINGKPVSEKFQSEYGFTICYLPIKNDQQIKFTDLSEIFKLIRKYK